MAELEQGLEELKEVKQAFKDNIIANNVSTSNVEFRNMPELLKQMGKRLPTQTKSVEPTKYTQNIKADVGYKLDSVEVKEIPSQYIIPTGTKEITENNEYDITQYSKVKVAVKSVGTGGNPKFSQLIDGTIENLEESDLSEPNRIKDYTFYYCKNLTSAVIPSNITSIGASAFEGCSSLQTLVMADGVQSIGASAFKGINASAINIPTTLSVLESEVFANNTALNTITIPANIVEIKDNVFNGCSNLTEITMDSFVPPIVSDTSFPASVTTIYVKYGAYDEYVASWSSYVDKIVRLPAIPSTISVIVDNYLGEKISGATVTIDRYGQTFTGTTDSAGLFVQGDLQPAVYTVSVANLEGFKTPDVSEVVVVEDSQNSVTITYLEKPAFTFSRTFSENTPAQISAVSAEISANNMTSSQVAETFGWNVGDTISYPLSTGENVEMRIIGFNHDDLSDGSGKAGITLEMTDCLAIRYRMNSEATNKGGYEVSEMRISTLPTIKQTLPQEWQDVIKFIDKKSANGASSNYTQTLTTSEDLFLLSVKEVFGKQSYYSNAQDGVNEGSQYEYWGNNTNRIKYYDKDNDGVMDTATVWYLRSCYKEYSDSFCTVHSDGALLRAKANATRGVSFAFCV